MFKSLLLLLPLLIFVICEENEIKKKVVSINEDWVCRVKSNCIDCLSLTQCAWCNTTSDLKPKCFSPKLTEEYCPNETIFHFEYGLSFESNARCACQGGVVEPDCRSPDAAKDAPDCSGRGKCKCGRCVCDPIPDPDNPTKTIVGRYCQLDNFSCDGPHCNEGPYSYITETDSEETKEEMEQPEVIDDSEFNSKEHLP